MNFTQYGIHSVILLITNRKREKINFLCALKPHTSADFRNSQISYEFFPPIINHRLNMKYGISSYFDSCQKSKIKSTVVLDKAHYYERPQINIYRE